MDDYESAIERLTKIIVKSFNELKNNPYQVSVGISARHIHLTRESIDVLFGTGYELTPKKPLSQPGQYASEETVLAEGPSGEKMKLRILGPERKYNQIEISASDARKLGLSSVPVRVSGNVKGTPGIKINGPSGNITLSEGVIIPERHVHMTPGDAQWFGVSDGDKVQISVSGERGGVFGNVSVRVSKSYRLEVHLDTDEGNAFGLSQGQMVVLKQG